MSDQMSDRMWTALGDKVEPDWTPERDWAVNAAIARRSNRRRVAVRAVAAVGSVGGLAAGGFALGSRRLAVAPAASSVSHASGARNAPIAGDRGETVRVTQLSPGTVLTPLP